MSERRYGQIGKQLIATVDNAVTAPHQTIAELQRQIVTRTAQLDEARAKQTATAEVLGVINSSPGDLKPVFDAMLERATAPWEAAYGNLFTFDGKSLLRVAVHGAVDFPEWYQKGGPISPTPGETLDLILRVAPVVHVIDATDAESYRSDTKHRVVIDRSGIRIWIGVPLRSEGDLFGAIVIYRLDIADSTFVGLPARTRPVHICHSLSPATAYRSGARGFQFRGGAELTASLHLRAGPGEKKRSA